MEISIYPESWFLKPDSLFPIPHCLLAADFFNTSVLVSPAFLHSL